MGVVGGSVAAICLAGLLLAACAPVRYIKPGMTEAELAQDLDDCSRIARNHAVRDAGLDALRPPLRSSVIQGTEPIARLRRQPSIGELELRYGRICMLSRGYELAVSD